MEALVQNNQGISFVRLDLSHTQVTDKCVEQLRSVNRIFALNLAHTNITDNSLESIRKIKQLQEIDLTGTRLSPEKSTTYKNVYRN
ncbi:MAG: hypothetical protein R3C11_13355 [Planctomycetaceae bacterium]